MWRLDYSRQGEWVVFFDAGAAGSWARQRRLQYGRGSLPALSTVPPDVGAGLDFDLIGFFVAKAVSESKIPANFFVRLRHRF